MRWIALLAAAACTGDETKDSHTGTTTDPSTTDTTPEVMEDRSAELTARVVDENGAPIEAASVRFCRGPECKFADSDADGRFGFTKVVVDWHSLEIVPPSTSSGLATAFAPVVFETETTRDVTLHMVPLDAPVTLTGSAEARQMGDGLQIDIALGDLEPPTFVKEATEVAGVRLEKSQWVPVDEQAGSVVAQWYLEPFDHHAKGDLPMTFSNDYKLKDGTELKVLVGDYLTSEWLEAGTLTVNAGAIEGTANLPVTSTVVLLDVSSE